ncbi:hypothetical protein [Streptomyces sp. 1222.5]
MIAPGLAAFGVFSGCEARWHKPCYQLTTA